MFDMEIWTDGLEGGGGKNTLKCELQLRQDTLKRELRRGCFRLQLWWVPIFAVVQQGKGVPAAFCGLAADFFQVLFGVAVRPVLTAFDAAVIR